MQKADHRGRHDSDQRQPGARRACPGARQPIAATDDSPASRQRGTASGTGSVGSSYRFAANEDTHDAERLQKDVAAIGATPIKRRCAGSRTSVVGTIRSITLQPVTGTPALHADLWDGTGYISLIWLGRRQIPGIDPGRRIVVHGRLATIKGEPTIFNPTYELRSAATEQ